MVRDLWRTRPRVPRRDSSRCLLSSLNSNVYFRRSGPFSPMSPQDPNQSRDYYQAFCLGNWDEPPMAYCVIRHEY